MTAMNEDQLLNGLDAVELESAADTVRDQTKAAFQEDSEHGEALRAAAEVQLGYEQVVFELYDQLCEVAESAGADAPDRDARRRFATLAGKALQKHQMTWVKSMGVEGLAAGALLAHWAPEVWGRIKPRIIEAIRNNRIEQ